jgi:hypothetical protein
MTDADPEMRLVQAIIQQAANDMRVRVRRCKQYGHDSPESARNIADEAEMWVLSHDISVGSFDWYCHLMGCRADKMRKYILDMRNQGVRVKNMHSIDKTHAYKSDNHDDDCCCQRCNRSIKLMPDAHGQLWFGRRGGRRCGNE